jgi:type IV secretory pathway VirB10-like protein
MMQDSDFTWRPLRASERGRFARMVMAVCIGAACLGVGFVLGHSSGPAPRKVHVETPSSAVPEQVVPQSKKAESGDASASAAPTMALTGEAADEVQSPSLGRSASGGHAPPASEQLPQPSPPVVLLNPGTAERATEPAPPPARRQDTAAQADSPPPPAARPQRRQADRTPRSTIDEGARAEGASDQRGARSAPDYRSLRDFMLGR